jgi:acyl-CoA reductase-like NAD-dependent aldehyde dehydrogenase
MERTARHWINGIARGEPVTPSINPATDAVVGHFADGGEKEAGDAIAAARDAFDTSDWPMAPRLRQRVLLDWAAALHPLAQELAELLTRENGKTLAQSIGEVRGAISEIEYYAGLTRHIPGHVIEPEPGMLSTMLREPAGVAGIIVPWNAPAVLLARGICPALAAGCTVVVKPAPQVTLFNEAMLRPLLDHAQLPAGVVNLFAETGHAGAQLLSSSEDVDVICFTGSTEVGKAIMRAGAEHMKKMSLELGGKSCAIVLADADIQEVAQRLAAAATIISGQQCTAVRRVLVDRSRFDEMKVALRAAMEALPIGNGLEQGTSIGPLIDRPARDKVADEIARACAAAEEVILPGGPTGGERGAFLAPALVHHQDSTASFVQDEIFGPFLVLEHFEDERDAVRRANDTRFGLSASVWTSDGAAALRIARAVRNGTVWINDHNRLFAEAETGGYRQSGIGRLHGYDALADFTELKHIFQAPGVLR